MSSLPHDRPAGRPPAWRILIAGGGIPSLAFAVAVRQACGGAVAVTITDPGRTGPDLRAYAISPAALGMLDRLGVGVAVRARAQPIRTMRITDSRLDDVVRPEYLAFGSDDAEPLGFMVEAHHLAASLAAACRAAGVAFESEPVGAFEAGPQGIKVAGRDAGQSLHAEQGPEGEASGGEGSASAPGRDIRSVSLLVAADGARSRLREQAGIGWVGQRYRQAGIVATVAHERDHRGQAVQHFLPAGPFAILPLAGPSERFSHRSSIVWTEAERAARALHAMSDLELAAAVEARFGHVLGHIAVEAGPVMHPLAVGLARRFKAARFALLGDAAHEIHPLAGQGLNLGLADAASLAEHVVDAVRLGLDPGQEAVLARYERDRRFDAVALATVTDGLNRLFSNDRLPLRALRDLGLGIVDRLPGLKGFFAGEASGRTPRSPRLMRGEAL